MKIIKEFYGRTQVGQNIYIYTLENTKGVKVKIIDYGATVVSIITPDKQGNFEDIVLGFDKLEDYFVNTPYFGSTVGRHANRIEKGSFELNGKSYKLPINNGGNHLHGGLVGFNKVIWEADIISIENREGLKLSYLSKDGEEGYPGNLHVKLIYSLDDDNSLGIDYFAVSDEDTLVNLTNHTYFNLSGQGKADILNHQLMIVADQFTRINKEGVANGEIEDVNGTAFDFRVLRRIGDSIDSSEEQIVNGHGYDHNWVLRNFNSQLQRVAQAIDAESGRVLEVYTTKPGIQFYTGNFLDERICGKEGVCYGRRSGFCLETQYFPNAIKHKHFPSPVLKKGKEYKHLTMYKFSSL